ncbi:MAG: DUF349 domain-containing protein, partial [Microbacterium sp.]
MTEPDTTDIDAAASETPIEAEAPESGAPEAPHSLEPEAPEAGEADADAAEEPAVEADATGTGGEDAASDAESDQTDAEPEAAPATEASPAVPAPGPKPSPRPTPAAVARPKPSPAPGAAAAPSKSAVAGEPWGRVDEDGTVSVREASGWRVVGQYPDGTPDEALAYFERKYADLASEVTLLEVRRQRAGASASDLRGAARAVSAKLHEAAAVGDLASLEARITALTESLAA